MAAIIVEPIQGEGGYIVPPDVFLQRLRELPTGTASCSSSTRCSRAWAAPGSMFAIEHTGVEPDIVTIGQGDRVGAAARRGDGAGGRHVVAARDRTPARSAATRWRARRRWRPSSCCATALMQNADDVGAHMMAGAKALMDKHPLIGDVRGRGLMIGIELVRDRQTKERATTERDALVQECFTRGLLVLGAGRNAIRLSPPLVLTRSRPTPRVGILDQALAAIWRNHEAHDVDGRDPDRRIFVSASWLHWRDCAIVGAMPADPRQSLGKLGEDLACAELCRRGYAILARRYRTRYGEIDIVARHGGDARVRRGEGAGRRRVRRRRAPRSPAGSSGGLRGWRSTILARHQLHDSPCRFDVVDDRLRGRAAANRGVSARVYRVRTCRTP